MTIIERPISSTPGSSLTAAAASPPFSPKPDVYSVTDVVLAFFKERAKDIAKVGSTVAFWTMQAIPGLPPNVTKFNQTLKDFKNFIGATELPEKLVKLGGSVTALGTGLSDKVSGAATTTWEKVGTVARQTFSDSLSLVNSIADTIDFAHLFVPISKETLKWVSGINFAATAGVSGNGAIQQIQNIHNQNTDSKKRTLYLINLARDISHLALGIIGLTFLLTSTPIVPWVIVACLTSGLIFSIGSYFYERLVDPENKGKNLNPAIVVENHVNQRRYATPVPVST